MRIFGLSLLLAVGLPLDLHSETIYAMWFVSPELAGQLSRFDSEAPWLPERAFPLDPSLPSYALEFDPVTRQLWGFDHYLCSSLCPPALDPILFDPLTGSWSYAPLPGLEIGRLLGEDADIDPLTRELRYFGGHFGGSIGNFSYSLDRLENRTDEPLNPPFYVEALAHKPPIDGAHGVETYAIGRPSSLSAVDTRGSWYQLARIGGAGGEPPTSSGQVTVIGAVDLSAERIWFDISADGTAYLAALNSFAPVGEENKLFRVNLESGEITEIGTIVPPSVSSILSGIAVAPPGLGGVVEIPALSRMGIVLFALALCAAALRIRG